MNTALIALWGVWRSFNALETDNEEDRIRVLRYWACFGCFLFYDGYVDAYLWWLPGHDLAKHGLAVATFLLPPKFQATDYIFSYAVLPLAYFASVGARRSVFLVIGVVWDFFTHHERRRASLREKMAGLASIDEVEVEMASEPEHEPEPKAEPEPEAAPDATLVPEDARRSSEASSSTSSEASDDATAAVEEFARSERQRDSPRPSPPAADEAAPTAAAPTADEATTAEAPTAQATEETETETALPAPAPRASQKAKVASASDRFSRAPRADAPKRAVWGATKKKPNRVAEARAAAARPRTRLQAKAERDRKASDVDPA